MCILPPAALRGLSEGQGAAPLGTPLSLRGVGLGLEVLEL
jgi:hypothetical protein